MMKVVTTVVLFLFLVHGARAQGELSLEDFFDTSNDPTKAPEKPKNEEPKKPAGGGGLSLDDFFDTPNDPTKAPEKPKNEEPKKPAGGGELSLDDFFDKEPKKPAGGGEPNVPAKAPEKPKNGISDSDLLDVLDGYKPDGGRSGGRSGGGPVQDPNRGGTDEKPQDPDFLWGQILKMLNTNMPEEFYMWISNLKQILTPLLERAMDLLQTIP